MTQRQPLALPSMPPQRPNTHDPIDDPRARRRIVRRRVASVLLIASVCLGAVVTRAVWHGRRALGRGDHAMALGQPLDAIEHWRRAARWYLPLAPHVGDAYQRLENLARAAESRHDTTTALAAWRGVRNSIMATRSLYTPHPDHLVRAEEHIAALLAGRITTADSGQAGSLADTLRTGSARGEPPARPPSPSPTWFATALLGFAMWLGGALLFALRALRADDSLIWRTAARAGALISGGLVLWMLGLYLA